MASVGIPAKLRRFGRVGPGRRRLLAEAVLWLAIARLAVLLVPFRRLGPLLGRATAMGAASPALAAGQSAEAREIAWAVTRAARHMPFAAACLPQAIAARRMLRRRGIAAALYLGNARDAAGRLEAHAWVLAGTVEVTGFPVARRFAPISCFL